MRYVAIEYLSWAQLAEFFNRKHYQPVARICRLMVDRGVPSPSLFGEDAEGRLTFVWCREPVCHIQFHWPSETDICSICYTLIRDFPYMKETA